MSDTPRTDAQFTDDYYCSGYVPTEFAQQLERELDEANARLNFLSQLLKMEWSFGQRKQ